MKKILSFAFFFSPFFEKKNEKKKRRKKRDEKRREKYKNQKSLFVYLGYRKRFFVCVFSLFGSLLSLKKSRFCVERERERESVPRRVSSRRKERGWCCWCWCWCCATEEEERERERGDRKRAKNFIRIVSSSSSSTSSFAALRVSL